MHKRSTPKLPLHKETLRMLNDAQLGAVIGGMAELPRTTTGGVVVVNKPPVSLTCMTLCGCPDTNKVTTICTR